LLDCDQGLNTSSQGPNLIPLKLTIIRFAVAAFTAAVDCQQRFNLQRQAEQLDESVGILLVVYA
jgi:hypothetical protein